MPKVTIRRGDTIIEVSDLSIPEIVELAGLNGHLRDVLETGLNHYCAIREAGALKPVADSGNTVQSRTHNRASRQVVVSAAGGDGVVLRAL